MLDHPALTKRIVPIGQIFPIRYFVKEKADQGRLLQNFEARRFAEKVFVNDRSKGWIRDGGIGFSREEF
jgi:hypothetical protein